MSSPIEVKDTALTHALHAMVTECEGVSSITRLALQNEQTQTIIDVGVTVSHNIIIPSFAKQLQTHLITQMYSLFQVKVERVNVSITGIS